jgi:hypothetical protein
VKLSHHRLCVLGAAVTALALAVGCDTASSGPAAAAGHGNRSTPPSALSSQALTEQLPQAAAPSVKRAMGGDCTLIGGQGCLSGLCLAVKPGTPPVRACSRNCSADMQCAPPFSCRQVYPSDKGWFCTPEDPFAAARTAALALGSTPDASVP